MVSYDGNKAYPLCRGTSTLEVAIRATLSDQQCLLLIMSLCVKFYEEKAMESLLGHTCMATSTAVQITTIFIKGTKPFCCVVMLYWLALTMEYIPVSSLTM